MQYRVRVWLLCVLVPLLLGGCGYSGMQGVFDYAGAAGDTNNPWVVDVSNFTACKRRPWDPDDKGQPSRVCQNTNFLDCGANPDHPPPGYYMGDPQVLSDKSTGRFWWAAMNPQQTGYCVSMSSTADPFAIERQVWWPASSFSSSAFVDRGMLVVTSNKVALSSYDAGGTPLPPPYGVTPPRRITKVGNKADFMAGATVRTATIVHDLDNARTVTLGPIAGNGGAFTWTVPHQHAITIGIVTGVPGDGGINTASAAVSRPWTWEYRPRNLGTPEAGTLVDLRADQQAVLRYREDNGNGELWAVTPVQENGLTQLAVDILQGISPSFAPALVNSYRFRTGNSHMLCPSLAVGPGPQNRGLVGWTSMNTNQWPKAEAFAFNRNSGTKYVLVGNADPGSQDFGTYGPRLDYCPQGMVATFDDGHGRREEWLGVGFNRLLAGAVGATAQQFSAFFCAQVGGDLCTRPAR